MYMGPSEPCISILIIKSDYCLLFDGNLIECCIAAYSIKQDPSFPKVIKYRFHYIFAISQ